MPDRPDEQTTATATAAPQSSIRGVAPATMGRGVEAVTPQGKTSIADNVVAKIAGIAAREIEGVHELVPSGAGAAIAGLASRVTGGDTRSLGVNVEVGQQEAAIDLNMVVDYGVSIPQVAAAVRQNIINRVAAMTGLTVKEVNIAVTDLYFPEEQARQNQPRVQ
ncbi:Asp23/Gls24 family envelope stress response protein [Thermogemmatispora sp.]|uniref:Asp23/Gls24 family envelope stress response protein n=1 Tax=Thermogemmatispora sp. TaxID=1968838 RepID=UPI002612088B|nr:Asp23/Gls24 family envelope stress response protein [Thermogemmatispora sp.]